MPTSCAAYNGIHLAFAGSCIQSDRYTTIPCRLLNHVHLPAGLGMHGVISLLTHITLISLALVQVQVGHESSRTDKEQE